MGELVLKCQDLHKKFGKKEILKGVSLELYQGDILGFIGPNGAGKTTTIKLILGLQGIDKGTVKINGYDIQKDFEKAIERVGAIVENPDLYMYLSGYKNLQLISNLYKNVDKERIDEVEKKFELFLINKESRINDKVSKYSLGMRQRLGIGQAILHKPNILILDEPTNGLDPEGIKELRDLIQKLTKEENMAVLISSHNLAELDNFCTKVCIIKNGEVLETKEIKELKEEANAKYTLFKVNDTSKISELFDTAEILNNNEFKIQGNEQEIAKTVKKLVENNIEVYSINEETITLEEAFLKKTGGNKIV